MAKSKNLFTADDFTKDSGKKKFPWWIVALLVLAIIVVLFLVLRKDKTTITDPVEPAQVEKVAEIPESAPTTADAAVTSTNETTNSQEAPKTDEPKAQEQKPTTTTTQYSGDLSILNGKTLREKANVVIRGYFGNNPERKRTLGDAYKEIQDKVNEMYRNGEVR